MQLVWVPLPIVLLTLARGFANDTSCAKRSRRFKSSRVVVNLPELEKFKNFATRFFICKDWRRYIRERAFSSFSEIGRLDGGASGHQFGRTSIWASYLSGHQFGRTSPVGIIWAYLEPALQV